MRSLRTYALLAFTVLFLASASFAQAITRPTIRWVSTVPATCSTTRADQALVYKYTATAGLYRCSATNTYSILGGSSFTGGSVATPITFPAGTAAVPSIAFTDDADGSGTGLFRSAANAIGFSTNGTERWTLNASGHLLPFANNTYDIGNGTLNPRDIYSARNASFGTGATYTESTTQFKLLSGAAANVPFLVKLAASQTGNAIEVQPNGSTTPYFKVDSSGNLSITNNSAYIFLTDTDTRIAKDTGTSEIVFYAFGGRYGSVGSAGYSVRDTGRFNWSSTSDVDGGGGLAAFDTGFARYSAGVIRATNGNAEIRGLIGGGASVASAAALPLPTGRVFHVTGTTNITSITSTNFASGVCITLIFDGILTFTDGSNLKLNGNFVTSADDTISLCYDGTNWFETARATN